MFFGRKGGWTAKAFSARGTFEPFDLRKDLSVDWGVDVGDMKRTERDCVEDRGRKNRTGDVTCPRRWSTSQTLPWTSFPSAGSGFCLGGND